MKNHLYNGANNAAFSWLDSQAVVPTREDFEDGPLSFRMPGFIRRLRAATGDPRWGLKDAGDGALAVGYEDTHGGWKAYYVGRSGAFDEALIRKIVVHQPKFARHGVRDMIERRRQIEAGLKKDSHNRNHDIARNSFNYDVRGRKHFSNTAETVAA